MVIAIDHSIAGWYNDFETKMEDVIIALIDRLEFIFYCINTLVILFFYLLWKSISCKNSHIEVI